MTDTKVKFDIDPAAYSCYSSEQMEVLVDEIMPRSERIVRELSKHLLELIDDHGPDFSQALFVNCVANGLGAALCELMPSKESLISALELMENLARRKREMILEGNPDVLSTCLFTELEKNNG
jgi:hypothetical protein